MSNELQNEVEEVVAKEAQSSPVPQISYKDFTKLDIRIGTVEAVEIVEGADKLLKLTVNLGEKDEEGNETKRQIVSGIREFFNDPQYLVGKQCPFVANLEPRVIRGFESQGMIMAASTDDGVFALLNPHIVLPAGTKVN